MKTRWLVAIFAVWAILLSAAIALFVRSSPDDTQHQSFIRTLNEYRTLDQAIPRHALEAHFGFVSNYDALTADDRARAQLQRRLQLELPAFLTDEEREGVVLAQARYTALANERGQYVERFKTENALLRNSVEYFPNAARALLAAVQDPVRRDLVTTLQAATLSLITKDDPVSASIQRTAMAELRGAAGNLDPQTAVLLDLMLRHASAISEHKSKTRALLNSVLTLPLESARIQVEERYGQALSRAQRTTRLCGYVLSGMALVLLCSVAFAVQRQRQAAAGLARANEDLESAVAARTTELHTEMARRAQMELELRQAQKLEAVGQLASGIAHEINTPIQYVGDSIYFLRQAFTDVMRLVDAYAMAEHTDTRGGVEVSRDDLRNLSDEVDVPTLKTEIPAAFERTLEGTRQVASIVRAMKTFAHTSAEKAPLDLNAAIRSTLIVARNEYKYVADVETELGHIPDVTCNAGGIRQVLLNLVINAAHAIVDAGASEEKRGAIRISTAKRNQQVVVSIADTGTGIPEGIRERIFEPFFTTKEPGRGSGQGLAISRSIVTQHGGKLWFRSELGRGTIFFIELPIAPAETAKLPGEAA